jgi:hypothetical protein
MEGTQYIKVLVDGKSCHGGSMAWSLPHDGQPGGWHEITEPLAACRRGLHFTDNENIGEWLKIGCTAYEIEPGSEVVRIQKGKFMTARARLIRELETPGWWKRVSDFLEHIKTVKFFDAHGEMRPEWKMFDTQYAAWAAARDAARDAAQAAAQDAAQAAARAAARAAAWDAARAAAWAAAWDAAWDAAQAAAQDAAQAAAQDAARAAARAAAWDAALYSQLIVVEDLTIADEHRSYVQRRWGVYELGYGCACDVDGVLYCYKKP